MPLIAVTGGIAAGKSTVSRRLADLGAVVVDADALVRELQEPGQPVLTAIVGEFGDQMLRADGSLDRARLGEVVFGDSVRLAKLNALVHPAVRDESKRRFAAALEHDPNAVVVYDVPLLVEARRGWDWDLIVVVHAPREIRLRRLIEERRMSEADAAARIARQASDEQRLAIADVVIDTSGAPADTLRQTDALWDRLAQARVDAPGEQG